MSELLLLDDILAITSKLCLLLQSDHKDFKEDQNHAGSESLKKSPALLENLCNFNAESIVSKWLRVDNKVTEEHFYLSTTVPFIKALLVEMKDALSLDNLPALRAMTCLNPDKIPKENDKKFLNYGKNDISTL